MKDPRTWMASTQSVFLFWRQMINTLAVRGDVVMVLQEIT